MKETYILKRAERKRGKEGGRGMRQRQREGTKEKEILVKNS